MIVINAFAGRRVGVLGAGRSGLSAARALRAGGGAPVMWDDGEPGRATAAAEGFEIADLREPDSARGLALLVVSPGVPHLYPEPHPAVAAALEAGVPLDNDVGLFFDRMEGLWAGVDAFDAWSDQDPSALSEAEIDARLDAVGLGGKDIRTVAVTGSNGKSTTASLIHHLLVAAGRTAHLGGNIGRAVLDLPEPAGEDETIYVLELSSYQLELASTLPCHIAVHLNLTPDHLDRHGGLGGYAAAKRRLFLDGAPDIAVLGVDDLEGRFLRAQLQGAEKRGVVVAALSNDKARLASEAAPAPQAFLAGERVEVYEHMAAAVGFDLAQDGPLRGPHNEQNAAAAILTAREIGLSDAEIVEGLATFRGLPHRQERLGSRADGVVFVNDSKATNGDAAATALRAFDRVRWLAGGAPKAGGLSAAAALFPKVAKAYLYGEAAQSFAAELAASAPPTPHAVFPDLAAALARADAEAQPGDCVLLSPAAASFDQFPNFEARGEAFRALVSPLLTKSS